MYPSLFEGFGLPVLEAMACSTPIITSETTSLNELAGDHVLTVDPHDPEAIAEAIGRLIDSPQLRERLAGRACHYAREEFKWSETADKTFEYLIQKQQE